jgi:hypothetical protein
MSRLATAKTGSTNWPEFGFTATGTVTTFAKNTRLPKFLGPKVTTALELLAYQYSTHQAVFPTVLFGIACCLLNSLLWSCLFPRCAAGVTLKPPTLMSMLEIYSTALPHRSLSLIVPSICGVKLYDKLIVVRFFVQSSKNKGALDGLG